MLLLAVPFSLCWHLPQAEYKVWGFLSLYLCIWLLRALEKELPLENLSDKWEKNIPSKCLLTFFLTALLSPSDHMEFHELLFERLKTKVHTQPLVTGLRDDFLYLWATFHRGNSVSVNHSKSSLMVQLGTQAHWRILSDPFCLVFPGFTSVRFRAEQNSLRILWGVLLIRKHPTSFYCVCQILFWQSKWVSPDHWFIWNWDEFASLVGKLGYWDVNF